MQTTPPTNTEKKPQKKGKSPAFQFYAADFLADENVALMNNEQLGCYIRLISYAWREGSIPADLEDIASLCRTDSKRMTELWTARLCDRFKPHAKQHGRLVNSRCEHEREKQKRNSREKSVAGKKGALARWHKDLEAKQPHASAIILPMAKDSSSSSSSSSSSTSVVNIERGASPPHPSPPALVQRAKHVWISNEDFGSLLAKCRYPEEVKHWVAALNTYLEETPRKRVGGKKPYASHYRVILKWRSAELAKGHTFFNHPEPDKGWGYYRDYVIKNLKEGAAA